MNYGQGFGIMADGIFAIYLFWVSRQDLREMQVVRYSHVLGLAAVALKACLCKKFIFTEWVEMLLAALVVFFTQFVSGRLKLYGPADSIVLFMGGVFFLAEDGVTSALTAYFVLQAIAGVLLLAVQTSKGNVKGMHLRVPVPYIPYISVAFFLTKGVL